jgi:hypothetical protein
VVGELERCSVEQRVARLSGFDFDLQPPSAKAEAEGQSAQSLGKARGEAEGTGVVAHAAEAGDGDDPGAGERGDVEAVAGVVFEVVEVDQGGFAEVVVGQLEVAAITAWVQAESEESRTVSAS